MGKNEVLWGDAVEDEMLPLTLPPPLNVVDSSTSSRSQFSPWDSPSPQFHHPHGGSFFPDTLLHFNSLLGSLPSLPSTTTTTTSPATPPSVLIPLASHSHLHPPCLSPDPWFAKQTAKCHNVSTFAWVPAIPPPLPGNCDESSRSPPDGSSISEQVQGRRRCLDGGKAKEPSKFAEGGDDSVITTTKRSREDEDVEGVDIGPPKQPKLGNEEEEDEGRKKEKKEKKEKGGGGEGLGPPKDCIHVRARRGQATDSHSLAERVRREKISERMKILQDLVPSCSKVTGKALVLDEIINYVQSLQQQVEYLSMKLASVNTNMHYSMNTQIMSKDMFQSINSTTTTTAAVQLPMLEPPLHEKMQECTNFKYSADPPLPDSRIPPLSGPDDQILAPFRSEDLHSIVEMGLFGQMNPLEFDCQGQMNKQHEDNGGASAVANKCKTFSNSYCRESSPL